jgi:hypothetical protein
MNFFSQTPKLFSLIKPVLALTILHRHSSISIGLCQISPTSIIMKLTTFLGPAFFAVSILAAPYPGDRVESLARRASLHFGI